MQENCEVIPPDQSDYSYYAALFKLLGDPQRLTILATLARADAPVCVCDFTDALPLNQPTVSHHLKLLRDGGLVATEKRGTWVYYRLAKNAAARIRYATSLILPEKVTA
jgi:ArsR family transcriptional regulator